MGDRPPISEPFAISVRIQDAARSVDCRLDYVASGPSYIGDTPAGAATITLGAGTLEYAYDLPGGTASGSALLDSIARFSHRDVATASTITVVEVDQGYLTDAQTTGYGIAAGFGTAFLFWLFCCVFRGVTGWGRHIQQAYA